MKKNLNHQKIKVLIIDTPINAASSIEPWRLSLPLAALCLAKSLHHNGFPASIYDPKLSGTFNKNGEIFFYGDSFDDIEKRIRLETPQMVCVTCLFSKDYNNSLEICRRVKNIDSCIKTVVGGFHATVAPEDFLSERGVDVVALGEGEETVVDLAKWANGSMRKEDIKGISWYTKKDGIVRTPKRELIRDLDTIGFPDYSLINLEEYFMKWKAGAAPRRIAIHKRFLPVVTSRGCPYRCCFCSVYAVCGRGFRKYSAKTTLDYIKHLITRYGVQAIDFEDDNLSFDRVRFEEIVDGLLSLDPPIMWGTPNGVRADTLLDEELLRKIKKSGCQYLTVGVESGDQEFLNHTINKALDLNAVIELSRLCQKVGIPLNAFFIIGFPTETKAQIKKTLDFANRLNRDFGVFASLNSAFPIKGTKMYEDCVKNGFLTEEVTPISLTKSSYHWGSGIIKTSEFSPDLLRGMIKKFNRGMILNYVIRIFTHPIAMARLVRLVLVNQRDIIQHFFME